MDVVGAYSGQRGAVNARWADTNVRKLANLHPRGSNLSLAPSGVIVKWPFIVLYDI